ncbi:MAG TPA: glutamyl-tRNA reductase [Prosthecobacter sp.]|nr:glutamyl-tRNA reductase [Prosthecobacter sp.]HRK16786.1 glutamyl-tRNA reductase [Prosthecobacter sp.]
MPQATEKSGRLVCLGLNYRTTPVEVREKVAFPQPAVPAALREVAALPGFDESVVLSTCNRVELYAAHHLDDCAQAHATLRDYLVRRFDLATGQAEALVTYGLDSAEAARHLFRVVSGLDSMVLGETEIFGQVKDAYKAALETGVTGRALNKLFQHAFSTGKKVRNQTSIQRGSTSVGSVAVDLAEKIHDLAECRVMLVGAGEMSRTCAQSLLSRGAKSIIVSNRNYDRAVELAAEMRGSAIKFDAWEASMHEVDVIISSTSAPHFVIHPEQIRQVMRKRRWEPLLIIDIAVPRDVDPRVNEIEGVYLYDIDALQAIADEGRRERQRQLAACEQIIEQQLEKFGLAASRE